LQTTTGIQSFSFQSKQTNAPHALGGKCSLQASREGDLSRLILAAALLVSMSGVRSDTPYDFNGLKLGTPLATVQDQRQATCFLDREHKESIGGVAVDTVSLQFDNGRLSVIAASFPEQDFEKVLDALKGKYGNPTQETTTSAICVDTKWTDHEATWSSGSTKIKAKKCNRRMFRSTVEYRGVNAKF
jgi:hypothetical protein